MEQSCFANCPFCDSETLVLFDALEPSSTFVSDCENCCRPFEVTVITEGGEVVSLEIQ